MSNGGFNRDRENSGVLFAAKQKKSQNSPDYTGNIVLSDELLEYLNERMSSGQPLKLSLSAWNKRSQQGSAYFSIGVQEEWQGQARPGGGGGYPQRQPERQPAPSYPQRAGGRTSFKPAPRPSPGPRADLDDEIPF